MLRSTFIGPCILIARICRRSRINRDPANPRALTEVRSQHSRERGTSSIHSRVTNKLYGASRGREPASPRGYPE